nr:PhoH family protein [Nitrosomonas sp.]
MKSKSLELSFTPADNQRLANLCGVLDENLKQVETALDVTISRRGERFSLYGDSDRTKLAADVLRRFYDQSRQHLSLEQIQLGLIEARN